jgi:hypothetical protein
VSQGGVPRGAGLGYQVMGLGGLGVGDWRAASTLDSLSDGVTSLRAHPRFTRRCATGHTEIARFHTEIPVSQH